MADHVCPYDGQRTASLPNRDWNGWVPALYPCGAQGWLCHRCREDRADARNREQIEAVRAMRDAEAQIGRLVKRIDELEATERGHFKAFQHLLCRLEAKEKSDG